MLIAFSAAWNFTCEIGWSGLYTINAELYPTEIRGLGVGWGNAFSKFAGIINPVLTGVIMDLSGGKYIVMVLIGTLFVVCAIASMFFRETRNVLKGKASTLDRKKSDSFVF
mmetsp:Transcript_24096/g.4023  ORF Transcript_24096/g.4023 Transcript_24096/m.4023 type:complete len:111 (-) Transcript_24096:6-338(-)